MKHNSYYPTNVPEQILWLTNFFNKLTGHAPALGVSVAACAAAVADARWLIYLLGSYQPALKAWSKSCTDFIRETGSGCNCLTKRMGCKSVSQLQPDPVCPQELGTLTGWS